MDEDQLGLVEIADIDEIMAVKQKNGDRSKSMSELDVSEKYNRMSTSPDLLSFKISEELMEYT